jgi:hypothetical protein
MGGSDPLDPFEIWRTEIDGLSQKGDVDDSDGDTGDPLRLTLRATYRSCAWCREQYVEFHQHEALVKRSAVPLDKQYLIFKVENTVPLHPECHIRYGQTKEMTRRCLALIGSTIGYPRVGRWYTALWQEHGLSVPKGLLVPPGMVKAHDIIRYCNISLPEEGWHVLDKGDYRVWVATRWQGRRPKWSSGVILSEWNGVSQDNVMDAIETGYWKEYLEGVFS